MNRRKFITLLAGGRNSPPYLLDGLTNIVGAYSIYRTLKKSYVGPLVRIREANGNAESDFGSVGGVLNTTAINTFLAGAEGYVVVIYDQSGKGNNAIQSDSTKQARYIAGGIGGKPSAFFTISAAQRYDVNGLASNFTGEDKPISVIGAHRTTGVIGVQTLVALTDATDADSLYEIDINGNTSYRLVKRDDGANVYLATGGTPNTNNHLYSVITNGIVANLYLDKSQIGASNQNVNTGLITITRAVIGARSAAGTYSNYFGGYVPEIIISDSAMSEEVRQGIENDITTTYLSIASQANQPKSVWNPTELSDGVAQAIYRIPSVVKSSSGRLLAFSEARKNNGDDHGVIGIVRKYSDDAGITWSNFAGGDFIAAPDATYMYGNPTATVAGSRIWLFCNQQVQTDTATMIRTGTGTGTRKVFVLYSDDDGDTFSSPLEITATAKPSGWTWVACGPGHAIVTSSGRIVVPYFGNDALGASRVGVFYSDDGGTNWLLGAASSTALVTECQVAELSNGNLHLNCRRIGVKNRFVFISSNGGETFDSGYADTDLIDPICEGSVLSIGSSLYFSNPHHLTNRQELTVRKSINNGTTWSHGLQLYGSETSGAYSDLVEVVPGTLGCLWEFGNGYIRFSKFEESAL